MMISGLFFFLFFFFLLKYLFFLPVLKRGKPKKGKNDLISAEEGDDPFADISSVGRSLYPYIYIHIHIYYFEWKGHLPSSASPHRPTPTRLRPSTLSPPPGQKSIIYLIQLDSKIKKAGQESHLQLSGWVWTESESLFSSSTSSTQRRPARRLAAPA